MVIIHRDVKRKRKNDNKIACSVLSGAPKRTKVHAQRKFAQGSNVNSPVITPVQEIERQEKFKSDSPPEQEELLPMVRPHTEDFLTFLCFRGTTMLPPTLNIFNSAPVNSRKHFPHLKTEKVNNYAPIINLPSKTATGNNDRPFIAFGVRKRADPVLVSKHMDKKRRHALALQALRRKYQEQKMAKIRAVTISKLSEKNVSSKNIVPTRSLNKTDTAINKKLLSQKPTTVKVVSTKRVKVTSRDTLKLSADLRTKLKLKTPIRTQVKKKMCLRSFRGRFIQHELSLRKVRKRRISLGGLEPKLSSSNLDEKKVMSEFSSDDDQPLAVRSPSKLCSSRVNKKSATTINKSVDISYRITRTSGPLRSSVKDKMVKRKIPPIPSSTPFVKLHHPKNIISLPHKTKSSDSLKKSVVSLQPKTSPRQCKSSIQVSEKKVVTPKSDTSVNFKVKAVSDRNLRNRSETTKIIKHHSKIKCTVPKNMNSKRKNEIVLEKNKIEKVIKKNDRELRKNSDKNDNIIATPKRKIIVEKMNRALRRSITTTSPSSDNENINLLESPKTKKEVSSLKTHSDNTNPIKDRNLRSCKKTGVTTDLVLVDEKTDVAAKSDLRKVSEKCEVVLEKYKTEDINLKNDRDLRRKKEEIVVERRNSKENIDEHNRNLRQRNTKVGKAGAANAIESHTGLKRNIKIRENLFRGELQQPKNILTNQNKTRKKLLCKTDSLKLKDKLRQLPNRERTFRIMNRSLKKQSVVCIPKHKSPKLVAQTTQSSAIFNKRFFLRRNKKSEVQDISNNKSPDYLLRNKIGEFGERSVYNPKHNKLKSKSRTTTLMEESNKKCAPKYNSKLEEIKIESDVKEFFKPMMSESCNENLNLSDNTSLNTSDEFVKEGKKLEKSIDIIEDINYIININKTKKVKACDNQISIDAVKNNPIVAIIKDEKLSLDEKDFVLNSKIDIKGVKQIEKTDNISVNDVKQKSEEPFLNNVIADSKLEKHHSLEQVNKTDKLKNTQNNLNKQDGEIFFNQKESMKMNRIENINVSKDKPNDKSANITDKHTKCKNSPVKNVRKCKQDYYQPKKGTSHNIQKGSAFLHTCFKDKLRLNKSKFTALKHSKPTKILNNLHSKTRIKVNKNGQACSKLGVGKNISKNNEILEKSNSLIKQRSDLKSEVLELTDKDNKCEANKKQNVKNSHFVPVKLSCNDNKLHVKGKNISRSEIAIEKLVERFDKKAKISDEPAHRIECDEFKLEEHSKTKQVNPTNNKSLVIQVKETDKIDKTAKKSDEPTHGVECDKTKLEVDSNLKQGNLTRSKAMVNQVKEIDKFDKTTKASGQPTRGLEHEESKLKEYSKIHRVTPTRSKCLVIPIKVTERFDKPEKISNEPAHQVACNDYKVEEHSKIEQVNPTRNKGSVIQIKETEKFDKTTKISDEPKHGVECEKSRLEEHSKIRQGNPTRSKGLVNHVKKTEKFDKTAKVFDEPSHTVEYNESKLEHSKINQVNLTRSKSLTIQVKETSRFNKTSKISDETTHQLECHESKLEEDLKTKQVNPTQSKGLLSQVKETDSFDKTAKVLVEPTQRLECEKPRLKEYTKIKQGNSIRSKNLVAQIKETDKFEKLSDKPRNRLECHEFRPEKHSKIKQVNHTGSKHLVTHDKETESKLQNINNDTVKNSCNMLMNKARNSNPDFKIDKQSADLDIDILKHLHIEKGQKNDTKKITKTMKAQLNDLPKSDFVQSSSLDKSNGCSTFTLNESQPLNSEHKQSVDVEDTIIIDEKLDKGNGEEELSKNETTREVVHYHSVTEISSKCDITSTDNSIIKKTLNMKLINEVPEQNIICTDASIPQDKNSTLENDTDQLVKTDIVADCASTIGSNISNNADENGINLTAAFNSKPKFQTQKKIIPLPNVPETSYKKNNAETIQDNPKKVQVDTCESRLKQQECRVSLENIISSKIDLILKKESRISIEQTHNKHEGSVEKHNKCDEQKQKKNTKRKTTSKPDVIPEEPRVQRPSRKTKEAAAIYMEILGHKLVEDDIDDDNISIDSFPELPNVRKMEQRENELKAKAKCLNSKTAIVLELLNSTNKNQLSSQKSNKTDVTSNIEDADKIVKEPINSFKEIESENNVRSSSSVSFNSKQEKTESVGITRRPIRSAAQAKPFIDFSFSDSDESFYEEKRVSVSKTLKTKSVRNKVCDKSKVIISNRSNSDSDKTAKNVIYKKAIKSEESKNLNKCGRSKPTKKKTQEKPHSKPSLSHSFSDSDEEPLSKLAQTKYKSSETHKKCELTKNIAGTLVSNKSSTQKNMKTTQPTSVAVDNPTALLLEVEKKSKEQPLLGLSGKPKRECTRLPQNYLPLPSSSDDDDAYIYSTEKSKNTKRLKTADLVCKDLDKRFGKGKVNMSTEQIEKWLNESALAGETISLKENDDILKYIEPSANLTLQVIQPEQPIEETKNPSITKAFKSVDACDSNDYIKSENHIKNPQLLSKQCERKTIFRKERNLSAPKINAFSASNEASVYAFEADNEDSVSTPFRRPSRRPSSTATSKSEDSSKYEEYNKTMGHFRVPSVMKQEPLKITPKPETAVILSNNLSTESILVMDLEVTHPVETNKQTAHIKPGTIDVNSTNKQIKLTNTTSNSSRLSENNSSSMDPPPTTFQRTRSTETKSYLRARTFDRMSDNSEDFKYKVPSSPSASSSSSTAKVTKKVPVMKTRVRPIEICTPVVVNDFPPNQNPALVFEAPLFHPNEKEFQDPLEYIEKIRVQAERFGICRIVPPSTFKPECKVSDEMRFTAYNQYVHKMLHRWGPNFKEFMAITNYLKTQNIAVKHPPWIGGVEVDLPRLYQIVQSLGGLKEVIEKKKWPKVADLMKIPKCAQDRLTKLDDIYCKYLLPYDTLSPDEKEKLFDEVETDWAKRESRALHKSQQNSMNHEPSPQSGESDSDNEVEECIVKGRSMALNGFYRIARNTMSMWFKVMEPPAEEVEQEFWKHVTQKQNHICVHSGSIDSGNYGYGFAVSKNSPFARHAWNLKVLTNNTSSILRSLGPVMGVTVPTIHVGMVFSACCWYRDPHSLPWIEYLHTGGSKIWYCIPDSMKNAFHSTLLKLVPNYCRNKSIWLPSDTVMVPPSILVENGVSISRTIQEPGEFVVVFPKAFTSCLCTGYVVSESVYFAPTSWLSTAKKVFEELQNSCEPSMFSFEKLLISAALDTRASVDILKQIIPLLKSLIESEEHDIRQLEDLGVKDTEKLQTPEVLGKKKKKFQEDNGNYECEVCCKNLFLSWVSESDDNAIYCLRHAKDYLETKKIELKNCKLYYTYNKEDVLALIEKIQLNIDSKLQKKMIGKSAVATQW